MTYISRTIENINGIAKKAGIGLVRDFTELTQLQSAPKGHAEFTKAAIERTESILRNELSKMRPSFPIVTSASDLPITECFVVSPLDGKLNFMHGIPYFAISIAIVKRTDILAALVHNPATGDTFFAEKGYGAFKEGSRNHLRTRVSARRDLAAAVVSSDDSKLLGAVAGLRNFGAVSLDLASVASGQFDGIISKENSLADIAAGILLVRESGGRVLACGQEDSRVDNNHAIWNTGNLVAGNQDICQKLFELV